MSHKMPTLQRPGSTDPAPPAEGGPNFQLLRHEKRGLPHFFTEDAQYASRRLKTLVSETPETFLERNKLLIDTDPRHVGHAADLEELELPGVGRTSDGGPRRPNSGQGKGKGKGSKARQGNKEAAEPMQPMSFASDSQIQAEEAALQDKILHEMRQNLQKLKEYGKEIGFSFDISKKKSQHGFMQGEKWQDDELETWKKQAGRMLRTPEPEYKQLAHEAPQLQKMGDLVFHLERMLNEMKFFRNKKQQQKDELQNEFDVSEAQEAAEQSGAGKMADAFLRIGKAREKIQDTEQKYLVESDLSKELTKEAEEEEAANVQIRDAIEDTAKQIKKYEHDVGLLKLQLKGKMHDVEKMLQQGKLVTMLEIKDEIKSRYKGELDMKRKVIQMQRKIKEELAEHEKRVTELTIKLRQQYDPTLDSPRRNELKRKAEAFEEVFDTMMKRIGESDINKIVEMFQKQTLTHQAWTEAVRDQEIRVKVLKEEKKNLDRQLQKVSSNQQHGIANETRQKTITGRRLDMATERLHNSTMRLMQLEGLIAHVKESMRDSLIRLKLYKDDVSVPPTVFPNDGAGGLLDVVTIFTDSVVQLQPDPEKYQSLLGTVRELPGYASPPPERATSPVSPKGKGQTDELVATMPKALKQAIGRAADDKEHSVPQDPQEFFSDEYLNRRIPFPKSREEQKQAAHVDQEQDERDALADMRDIITRDEIKKNAQKVQKAKEREKLEAEARDRGEDISASKGRKKKNKAGHA